LFYGKSVSSKFVHRQIPGEEPKTPAKRPICLRPKVSGTSGSFYDPQRANDLQRQSRDFRPASDLQRLQNPWPAGDSANFQHMQANDCDPPKLQHSQRNLQDPRPAKRPSLAWPRNKSANPEILGQQTIFSASLQDPSLANYSANLQHVQANELDPRNL